MAREIPPLATHLDIRFVDVPSTSDRPLVPLEAPHQEWRVVNSPAVDRSMIERDPALGLIP
jgi:hypothetical protein